MVDVVSDSGDADVETVVEFDNVVSMGFAVDPVTCASEVITGEEE